LNHKFYVFLIVSKTVMVYLCKGYLSNCGVVSALNDSIKEYLHVRNV